MREIDDAGVRFTSGWESFVPWPYDDKAKPVVTEWRGVRIKAPPRWHVGMAVRGTLTAGFGHTDAGKHPLKIMELVEGGRDLSKDEALDILHVDMSGAVASVNKLVKVPVSQGQFDALCDLCFNMGEGNLRKSSLIAKLNRGDYAGARAAFDLYVKSGGQTLSGLVRRRDAEQVLWDSHAEAPPAPAPHEDEDFETTPKDVEAVPPPKTMAQSNIGNAQIGTIATTVATAGAAVVDKATDEAPSHVDQIGALIEKGQQATDLANRASDLADGAKPLWKVAIGFLGSPEVLAVAVVVIVIICGFAWWERRRHLHEDRV